MEKYYVAKIFTNRHAEKCNWCMAQSKLYLTKRWANNWARKKFNEIYPSNEDVTATIEELAWSIDNELVANQVSYIHA